VKLPGDLVEQNSGNAFEVGVLLFALSEMRFRKEIA